MKVLMFGWEYPPHVFGGLATANYVISQGLHAQGDVETVLCLPRPFGDEDTSACRIVAMNCVPIAWRNGFSHSHSPRRAMRWAHICAERNALQYPHR